MKLYVPDPQKWVDFFDRVSAGKVSLNQTGGGRRHSIIPVRAGTSSETDKKFPIEAVLPAEQTTAQAKSELERRDIKPSDIADLYQSSAGGQRKGTKRKRDSSDNRKFKQRRKKDIFEIK